ncbi:helix-turn-helix domain-containing protein [Luteimonas sp. SX5]|uniref:Helix-turn-helix domain-containing protein n=1 Tax=Luteimonas galliterrae TaxID=2940486 RepID=A0ABT0MGH4_9GAMM|nr:helix-turn-helix domain-containing protein [Luteimonas galliterrae]MCL1633969.1 helix-turn-helix domain-containing protein [Luteimonas galliterrae]
MVDLSVLYQRSVVDGFDAQALLGAVRDTRFEQRLLGAGHFRACLQRVVFPHFSLDSGAYSLPIFASGSFGKGVVSLALALSCRDPMWANGKLVEAGQVMVFAEDSELNVRPGPGDWRWAVLLIERERLQQAAEGRLGRPLAIPISGWYCNDTPPSASDALCRTVRAVLDDASRWGPTVDDGRVAAQGSLLLGAFLDAVGGDRSAPGLQTRGEWMVRRRDETIRKAECFLKAQLDRPFDSRSLATLLGIGERRVERLFHEAYGLSPSRWHHIARLNAARLALLQAEDGERVTDIASRLGFGHLSRFSSEYRQIFGEYPRDTLRA